MKEQYIIAILIAIIIIMAGWIDFLRWHVKALKEWREHDLEYHDKIVDELMNNKDN